MRRTAAIFAILAGGLVFQPAYSAPGDHADKPRREGHRPHREGHMSASEAAHIAQKQGGGGRVLAVDRVDGGYRVKLLKKGEVSIVLVPAPAPAPSPAVPAPTPTPSH
ncbi:MAG: hypothetical protein ACRETW_15815 [Stenotrophobium sp.]